MKVILTDAKVIVNSVDLSDHVQKVAVHLTKDTVDITAMGAVSKAIALGLGDASVDVTFFADFAASSVDKTLQPLQSSASAFPIEVRPTSQTVSDTNPKYSGTVVLPTYDPISGAVGEASTMDVTFQNATQAGIVRGTV